MTNFVRSPVALVFWLALFNLQLWSADPGYKNIKVDEFEKMRTGKTIVILDVRTESEFKDGHIPGAVNVDVNAHDFLKKMEAMDKSKTYLVHCAAGRRSVTACEKLAKLNFPKLFNLEGGYRAWAKEAVPDKK